MVKDLGQPGYRGRLAEDAITIAQALQSAGYRSFISGKWHLGTDDPTRHGFEQFYGTLVSAQTFWDPEHYLRLPSGENKIKYPSGSFYGTNALTDHAIEFLSESRNTTDPWFLYLAYNAPHFPLQAPDEYIDQYIETYQAGWDRIREKRLERQKMLGIVTDETALSPRSRYWDWGQEESGINPAWEEILEDRQQDLTRRMAIYAAMVDIMDQNIGRLISDLAVHEQLENTMIIFISDNGACAEWDPYGFDIKSGPGNILHSAGNLENMGSPGTYHSVGSAWANASNTPWRLYKHYNHEGGISSPFIIHWPEGLNEKGIIERQAAHLVDLMPTILDVAGADYPEQFNGTSTAPLAGVSILPLLKGEVVPERALYFEHEGNRAIVNGPWKLTALLGKDWELYQIDRDRTEQIDLADQYPEIVTRLAREWTVWAESHYVTPFPDDYMVPYLITNRPKAD
jgi:arylsulfatase